MSVEVSAIGFLLLLTTNACWCSEADEANDDVVDDKKLPTLIKQLGEKIVNELKTPTEKKGKELIQDLFDYFNAIDSINILLDSVHDSRHARGKEIYRMVSADGGPPFAALSIDHDNLARTYAWEADGRDARSARDALTDIQEHWQFVGENFRAERTTTIKSKSVTDKPSEEMTLPPDLF